MDLSRIIAISGKPGLYLVVAQSPNSIIVENVENGRRMPAFASNKISALEDITMYSIDEDVPLGEIIQKLYDKNDGKAALSHKDDVKKLRSELDTVLDNCDHDRIYDADVRKLFQWYNLLQKSEVLKTRVEESEKKAQEEKAEEKKSEGEKKTTKAKESKEKSAPAKKKASKASDSKKSASDGAKKKAEKKDA